MFQTISKSFFIVASLMVFLSACSTAPINPAPPVDTANVPTQPERAETAATQPEAARSQGLPLPPGESTSIDLPASKPAVAPTNPAVLALLTDAEKYQQQGNMPAAQSRLQRAQRIAPRDPKVYYQMAQAHYALEDFRLAEQVALKGVSYAQGDRPQQKRFWLLLADIRQKSGNGSGAKKAREQAARF